jgi:hypothetical protein
MHDEKTLIAYDKSYKFEKSSCDVLWEVQRSTLEGLRASCAQGWCHRLPLDFRLVKTESPYLLMLATSAELDAIKASAKQQLPKDRSTAIAEYKASQPCGSTGCKRCFDQCSDFGEATPNSLAATEATVADLVLLSQQLKSTNRGDTAGVAHLKAQLWAIAERHGYPAESTCHPDNTEHTIEVGKRVADVLRYWPKSAKHLCALVLVHSYPDKVILDLPGGKRKLKADKVVCRQSTPNTLTLASLICTALLPSLPCVTSDTIIATTVSMA